VSVPEHPLRCGPKTSVTSPLRWRWFELRRHEKTHIQSSRPWECGNPEGISKECGKGGKPALWLSMLSTLCHFHGLLLSRQRPDKPICRNQVQCAAPATRWSSVFIACQLVHWRGYRSLAVPSYGRHLKLDPSLESNHARRTIATKSDAKQACRRRDGALQGSKASWY
jgi:hypothetical protein